MQFLFLKQHLVRLNAVLSKTSIINIVLFFALTAFLSTLIPPLQSPDEQDHLKRAYLLSKGRIAMETPAGASTGGFINDGLNEYASIFLYIAGNSDEKITEEMLNQARLVRWTKSETFNSAPGVSYYFPIIYSPQAIGLALGQALDLSVHHSYYLARTLSTLTIFFLLWAGFRIRTPGPLTIALLLMPLVVFQSVATSLDGITTALTVFCGSLFLRLMNNDEHLKFWSYAIFLMALLLLVTSRVNLLPMLLLPFVVFYKYKKTYMACFATAIIFCAMGWIFYAMMNTGDNRVLMGARPSELLLYYMKHPFTFLHLVYMSISHHQLSGFYITSFVGMLGWLDAGVSEVVISYCCLVLCIMFLLSMKIRDIGGELNARTTLLVVAVASFLLVFLMLLITWTPHPAEVIRGVQGRYFWAPAIIFSLAVTVRFDEVNRFFRFPICILLGSMAVVSLTALTNTALQRYYLSADNLSLPFTEKSEVSSYKHILLKSVDGLDAASGGYIDKFEISSEKVTIEGWGLFSQDDKEFYSDQLSSYEVIYKTVPRPDVSTATKDRNLRLAGFEIVIPLDQFHEIGKFPEEFCLYTKDPLFGFKRLQSGSEALGYNCKVSNHESE